VFGLRIVLRVESDRQHQQRNRAVHLPPMDPAQRTKDLKKVMLAAAQTPAAHAGGVSATIQQMLLEPDLHQQLGLLPSTPVEWYLERRQQYRYPKSARHRRRYLDYHLDPMPRVAVLMDGYENTDHVQCYPEGWCQDMEHFRPETVAGPIAALKRLAVMILAGGAKLRHLKRPLIAFSGLPFGNRLLLTEEDRTILWQAFGTPVFERYLGFGNETLAKECEAHDGLHLNLRNGIFQTAFDGRHQELILTSLDHLSHPVLRLATGLAAQITFEPCRCGQSGPRLMKLERIPREDYCVVPPPVVIPALAGRAAAMAYAGRG
jgi:hypothetical protein